MASAIKLQSFLREQGAAEELIELVPALIKLLPLDVTFEQDKWNVLDWNTRKDGAKVMNVPFDEISNEELRILAKIYILDKRLTKNIAGRTAKIWGSVIAQLDAALGPRDITKLSNSVFKGAQSLIVEKYSRTTPARFTSDLQQFGEWLCATLGLRISYVSNVTSNYMHGRKATDEERDEKLIDSRIITDLIAANRREDLIAKDRFFLWSFSILTGTGFRITELATLPKNCIVIEGENVGIRHFPEKKPKLDIHWILDDWANVIEDAVENLIAMTEEGRSIVSALRPDPGRDWPLICKSADAIEYFVGKFCHEWTANPLHNMFNPDGAWLEKQKRYVDVISLIDETGSQVQAAKRLDISRSTVRSLLNAQNATLKGDLPPTAKSIGKLRRTSWDTDSRVVSVLRLENYISLFLKGDASKQAKAIIDVARENYQLNGQVFPCPPRNDNLEQRFRREIRPVVETKSGKPLLQPEDALFVLPKYSLSDSRGTKVGNYSLLTSKEFMRWFCGESRSRGTGSAEDSCFSRLGIVDPRTGEIAKFTSHEIRHWLTTYFLEGGMPNDQVALLFNRQPNQNDTYDQTSSKTRLSNMREAIRDGGAMGHAADTYHEIAEYSREDAERYLEACTLQLNLMPHGSCSLSWGMEACPNHNGCFNGENGLCVNPNDVATKQELIRMSREADIALIAIPVSSPQHSHYQNIQRNLKPLVTGVCNDK